MRSTLVAVFFLMLSFVFAISSGSYRIPFREILEGLLGLNIPSAHRLVLFKIRLPRVLLSMAVGAGLSVSGAVLQAIFRNPLVDSFILGVSSGAAFGASIAILLSMFKGVTFTAFLFSIAAVFFTYVLARKDGGLSPISLVLSGIIVNAFFSALTDLLKLIMEHEKLAGVIYWLMGSFGGASWESVKVVLPTVALGCILVYAMRWQLNVISFGDETSVLLRRPELLKTLFIGLVGLITASSTAFCGVIGWVGLIVPHAVRMAFGPDHRTLIPLTMAFGASFMMVADTLSRSMLSFELPIGILTTLIGIPFFAFLLRKTGGRWQ